MKKILSVVVLLAALAAQGQNNTINSCPISNWAGWSMNLNPSNNTDSCKKYVNIDQSQPQNIWQIGTVNKTVFTSSYNGGTKALVTDTVNPYPANNVSSFVLKVSSCFPGLCCNAGVMVFFTHKYDTEAGVDGGTIEYSTDNGLSWQNVVQHASMCWNNIYAASNPVTSINQPGFSGNSNGWISSQLFLDFNAGNAPNTWLRFTFGSNGSVSGDGWMIGDMQLVDMSEGIETYGSTRVISVAPNPAHREVELKVQAGGPALTDVSVFDNIGKRVIYFKELKNNKLDVFSLPAGFYSVKCTQGETSLLGKFIKQ